MDIEYVKRGSKFIAPCERAIRATTPAVGQTIQVHFAAEKRGRPLSVDVDIRADDAASFGTDWNYPVASHFSQRIKAAATALRNCQCWGAYRISHRAGALEIVRVAAGNTVA